jgi:hypothetical protein
MPSRIDHLMWGAPDLEAAVADLQDRFGLRAVAGGVHPGRGTRNALLGLDDGIYLEIIAPDPAQPHAGFAAGLAALEAPALITFAAASGDLPRVARTLETRGYQARGPVATRRTTPSGDLLAWELLFPFAHPFGTLCPFFIDWGECRHPSADLTSCGRLEHLTVGTARAVELRALLDDLEVPVRVCDADVACIRADITITGGEAGAGLSLESRPQTVGLSFG